MTTANKTMANDRQVGGEHYKTGGLEHWDLFGPEYLMGCATKYVSRWRKKNGVQDLEKAKHYCEKLKESIRQGRKHPASATGDRQAVERWLPNAGLDFVEKSIVKRIMFWQSPLCIDEAIAGIDHLIETAPRSIDADESHHASLYPWQIARRRYITLPQDRRVLLDTFYTQRGNTMRLDECVVCSTLPRELVPCYTLVTNTAPSFWLLKIENVPEELRDEYPRLFRELTHFEHSQVPYWQQGLYGFTDDKWRLLDHATQWGTEN